MTVIRILATCVAVVLLAQPATAADRFEDTDGSVHEESIESIAAQRITLGCNPPANDRFCPEEPVTRGQMAAFLVRAFGLDRSGPAVFRDTGGSGFGDEIAAVRAAGIARGCNPPTNDRYCPDEPVTRGQMAAFLTRALDLDPSHPAPFVDAGNTVFSGDIAAIARAGITVGCNPPVNDRFCPEDAVTRGEMASLLMRSVGPEPVPAAAPLTLDIREGDFYLNGEPTNPGSAAEGLLLNSRMVQAISDFSGEMAFDPDENMDRFITALDEYRSHGLDAVTINLQGGLSHHGWGEDYWNSAWTAQGALDPAYASRLERVLDALEEREMVAIVGLFYFRQDQLLEGDAAIERAVDNAIEFLRPWKEGIIVEVVNEADHGLVDQSLLQRPNPRILVSEFRAAGYHASYSVVPGSVPSRHDLGFDSGLIPADVVFLHGNNRSAAEIAAMATEARARFPGLPIVFNEDGPTGNNSYSPAEYVAHMRAAVDAGASWGYYDQDGFQTAPATWSIDTAEKRAFFDSVSDLSDD